MRPDETEQMQFNDAVPDGDIVDDEFVARADDGGPQPPVYRERLRTLYPKEHNKKKKGGK